MAGMSSANTRQAVAEGFMTYPPSGRPHAFKLRWASGVAISILPATIGSGSAGQEKTRHPTSMWLPPSGGRSTMLCARGRRVAMWKRRVVATLIATLLPACALAQDAKTVLNAASKAMGATGLNSITFSGAASVGNFGQSRTISFGLASTTVRNYTRTIDFTQPASRAIGEATPPAGRGAPPPQSRPYEEMIAAASPWAQQLSIWITPWGFLRGAAANNAVLKTKKLGDVSYRTLTWSPAEKAPSGASYQV